MRIKNVLFFLLFVSAVLFIPLGLKNLNYGFKIAKLHVQLPHNPQWEIGSELSKDALHAILSQRFRFLGKGAQCYAFVSEDDQYVLKLFRFDRKKKKARPQKKADRFLSACKLGYELARTETALVYLHLNLSSEMLPILRARAPNGRPFSLPLDSYRFAIQKKAELLEKSLSLALAQGVLNQRIDAIADLLESRSAKGIGNSDPNLWRNFGFVGQQAVEIDFGNYKVRSDLLNEEAKRQELRRYLAPLRVWVADHSPEGLAHFDERMALWMRV